MGYSPAGWLVRAVPEHCDSSGVGGRAQQWCWCLDRRGLAIGQKGQPPVLAGVVCPGAGGRVQLQGEWQARMMWAWGRFEGDRIQGDPCTVLLAGGGYSLILAGVFWACVAWVCLEEVFWSCGEGSAEGAKNRLGQHGSREGSLTHPGWCGLSLPYPL